MCQANYKVLPLFRNCCRQDTNLSSFFSKHKLCIYSELSCSLTTKKFVSNIEQLRKNWQNSTFTTPNPPPPPPNQPNRPKIRWQVRAYNESLTITVQTNARCVPPPTSSTLPVPQALQRTPIATHIHPSCRTNRRPPMQHGRGISDRQRTRAAASEDLANPNPLAP
jgi:hypothetical protein